MTSNPLTSDDLEKTIADLALQTSPESINRWKRFTGIYSAYAFGIVGEIHRIHLENDSLYFDDQKLYEVQPGLFFSPDGEALDVRGDVPTFRSIVLSKNSIGALIAKIGFPALCGVIFILTIGWVLFSAIRRSRKHGEFDSTPYALSKSSSGQPLADGIGIPFRC